MKYNKKTNAIQWVVILLFTLVSPAALADICSSSLNGKTTSWDGKIKIDNILCADNCTLKGKLDLDKSGNGRFTLTISNCNLLCDKKASMHIQCRDNQISSSEGFSLNLPPGKSKVTDKALPTSDNNLKAKLSNLNGSIRAEGGGSVDSSSYKVNVDSRK